MRCHHLKQYFDLGQIKLLIILIKFLLVAVEDFQLLCRGLTLGLPRQEFTPGIHCPDNSIRHSEWLKCPAMNELCISHLKAHDQALIISQQAQCDAGLGSWLHVVHDISIFISLYVLAEDSAALLLNAEALSNDNFSRRKLATDSFIVNRDIEHHDRKIDQPYHDQPVEEAHD